jgi:hypothetical protein
VTDDKAAPRKRGRPPHTPDARSRKFVKFLAFKRATQDEISKVIGINDETLRIHYADELDVEKERMAAYLVESGYLQAVGGPRRNWREAKEGMTKFMLEKFAGVLPIPTKVEISGPDGGPMETKDVSARELVASRIAGLATRLRADPNLSGTDGSAS